MAEDVRPDSPSPPSIDYTSHTTSETLILNAYIACLTYQQVIDSAKLAEQEARSRREGQSHRGGRNDSRGGRGGGGDRGGRGGRGAFALPRDRFHLLTGDLPMLEVCTDMLPFHSQGVEAVNVVAEVEEDSLAIRVTKQSASTRLKRAYLSTDLSH